MEEAVSREGSRADVADAMVPQTLFDCIMGKKQKKTPVKKMESIQKGRPQQQNHTAVKQVVRVTVVQMLAPSLCRSSLALACVLQLHISKGTLVDEYTPRCQCGTESGKLTCNVVFVEDAAYAASTPLSQGCILTFPV